MPGADTSLGQENFSPAAGGPLGHVQSVSGSRVSIALLGKRSGGPYGSGMTVGRFVKIQSGRALIVGVIAEVSVPASSTQASSMPASSMQASSPAAAGEPDLRGMAQVDLMGE